MFGREGAELTEVWLHVRHWCSFIVTRMLGNRTNYDNQAPSVPGLLSGWFEKEPDIKRKVAKEAMLFIYRAKVVAQWNRSVMMSAVFIEA